MVSMDAQDLETQLGNMRAEVLIRGALAILDKSIEAEKEAALRRLDAQFEVYKSAARYEDRELERQHRREMARMIVGAILFPFCILVVAGFAALWLS